MASEITKQAIKVSFMKLLNNYPIEKIRVKDIVEDCGLNRNTFYYHYRDIYALLTDIFESETRKVIEEHPMPDTWEEAIIEAAEFALENKKAIYHIYNSTNRDQLERYLYDISREIMMRFIEFKTGEMVVDREDQKCMATFYMHAIVGTIFEWLQNGMKDDPADYIRRAGRIFSGNIEANLKHLDKNQTIK